MRRYYLTWVGSMVGGQAEISRVCSGAQISRVCPRFRGISREVESRFFAARAARALTDPPSPRRTCQLWRKASGLYVHCSTGRRGEVEAPTPLIETAEGRAALVAYVRTKKGKAVAISRCLLGGEGGKAAISRVCSRPKVSR